MTRPCGKPPSKARSFACPTCFAGAGEACWATNAQGDRHPLARYHAARLRSAGLEPPRGGKGGANRTMTGEELDTREQLLSAARAKLHTTRGAPIAGTSLRALARACGVWPSTLLRDGLHRPSVDARLRKFLAMDGAS